MMIKIATFHPYGIFLPQGKLLKPHIAKLVTALLESLSGLEPQYLNTLNLQLSKSKDAQDKVT